MSQIMNLTNLAPDIQETILFLPPTFRGVDPITERQLREVTEEIDWNSQRKRFHELMR
jgi:hypothetical protein